jgi:hypothetical protein
MSVQTLIQIRRGTASEWSSVNPTLSAGEWGYDTVTKRYKLGDGLTAWNSLLYSSIRPSSDDIVGVSGIGISFSANSGVPVTISVTGISSSQVNNFNSSVSGLLPVKSIFAGNNISVTPSGDNGFIISSSGTGMDNNAVKDLIGSTITGVSGIAFSYDNVGKTATISLSDPTIQSTDVTDFNTAVSGLLGVKSLVQSTGIGISNNNGIQTISVTGIPSSLISDFSSSVGSVVSTELIGGSGIELTYNSGSNVLTIKTTGVSYSGHSHNWSSITDASTIASLSELAYLSGVIAGTASVGRALVLDSNKDISGIRHLTSTGNLTVGGNLVVQGVTTTVNSTVVEIGDNIIRVNSSGLNTGGLEVYTGSDAKNLVWNVSNNRWEFSGGNIYTSGNFIGSLSGNASTVTNGVYTTDTGTVTSTMIANDTIVNADINSSAAISYSKLNLSTSIVNTDISTSAAIVDTKLATISTAGKVSNSATTATNANTASAIVSRDASGNFSAGTITASLSGNATSVTNGVYTTDSGTVTSTMIANDTIVNADINSSAGIVYSKLNLSNSITNNDISSSASIAVNKLASSGITFGSTIANLGNTITSFVGLSSISGTSVGSPTYLYNCVIDGGTP